MNENDLMKTALSVGSKISQEKASKQKELEQDLHNKIIFIINSYVREKIKSGMKPRAARRLAERKFNVKFKK